MQIFTYDHKNTVAREQTRITTIQYEWFNNTADTHAQTQVTSPKNNKHEESRNRTSISNPNSVTDDACYAKKRKLFTF